MADCILGSGACLLFLFLNKTCIVEQGSNKADFNDTGREYVALNMKTMNKSSFCKSDTAGMFQIVIFGVTGTVPRITSVEETNNVRVDFFDRCRIVIRIYH